MERGRGSHRRAVAALALAFALTAATPALGAPGVRYDAGQKRIYYVALDGQANVVTVSRSGDSYEITDTGVAGFPDADGPEGCSVNGSTAVCPAANVDFLSVAAFDLDDRVTVDTELPRNTFIGGGAGNDTLIGGPGDDELMGREGGDTLAGGYGDDLLDSGPGDPVGETFDDLDGGGGFDTLSYASRAARVEVDLGRQFALDDDGTFDALVSLERIVGGLGDDEIVGSAASETLLGGPGGADGADTLCGDLGADTVDYSGKQGSVNVTLDGPLPTDPALGEAQPDVRARIDCRPVNALGLPVAGPRDCTADDGVAGEQDCVGDDVENVVGSRFGDTITGNDPDPLDGRSSKVEPTGVNLIAGGGGDDLLDGGLGPDVLEGGSGTDAVTYASRVAPVVATLDGAANDGGAADLNPRSLLSDRIAPDIEDLTGGAAGDLLIGDAAANAIDGGAGADEIDGGDGADVLHGGAGDDTSRGGAGDDAVADAQGDDALAGGDGADVLRGGEGGDALDGGLGPDVMSGEAGSDRVNYTSATTAVVVTADGVAGDGRAGEGDDVGDDVESIAGGAGNDMLIAGPAAGTVSGGGGDDVLDGGAGPDLVTGGPGLDTVTYAARATSVTVGLGAPGGDGEAGEGDDVAADVEAVTGGPADDAITGNDTVNILNGGGGNDTLTGAGGDDQLTGAGGNDLLAAGDGNDALYGYVGDDLLAGGPGNDALGGGDGADSLDGGPGADALGGDGGTDTVVYATRTRGVKVDLQGTPGDGEPQENDLVKASVESVRTGAGADEIDTRDGVAGRVDCGAGTDSVLADPGDRLGSDCETRAVQAMAVCAITRHTPQMTARGVVPLTIGCRTAATGKLTLETANAVGAPGKRRKLRLGSDSFSTGARGVAKVKLRLKGKARRFVASRTSLRARAKLTVRPRGAAQSRTSRAILTIAGRRR